jgi:polar amino acid transport system substrate-binding protein
MRYDSCLIRPLACLLGAAGMLLTGCSTPASSGSPASASAPAASEDLLRVGITPSFAPLAFRDQGRLTGIEVDWANALGKALGKQIKFVTVPWEDQIDALMQGRTDIIMSGMSITPARRIRINFTEPYMRAGQTALVRRDQAAKMQLMLFSAGQRIGVQNNTTSDYFAQQQLSRAKIRRFKSPEDGAKALRSDSIDAFICDAPINWWLASKNETAGLTVLPAYLTEEQLAWGVRKSDLALLAAINNFLKESRETGEMDRLLRRWIPLD